MTHLATKCCSGLTKASAKATDTLQKAERKGLEDNEHLDGLAERYQEIEGVRKDCATALAALSKNPAAELNPFTWDQLECKGTINETNRHVAELRTILKAKT